MRQQLAQLWRDARSWRTLRDTPYGLTPAAVIFFTGTFLALDSRVFSFGLPDIAQKLGIGLSGIVTISQVLQLAGIFGAILLGWWGDRTRRVPLMVGATAVAGVASMAHAPARSPLAMGVARVTDDAATLAVDVPQFGLLADYYPVEARGRVFALIAIAGSIATVVALPITGLAIQHLGVSTTFLLFGAPILVMAAIAGLTLREPVRGYFERRAMGADETVALAEDEPVSFGESWRTIWASRTVRRLFISAMVGAAGDLVFTYFVFLFLVDHYRLTPIARAGFVLPGTIAAVIGGLLGGGLLDRLGRSNPGRTVMVLGTFRAIAALGLLGFAFSPPLGLLAVAFAVASFGSALASPAYNSLISQVIPANVRTQGLQMTNLALLPATVVALPLAAAVESAYGYGLVFAFAAPFFVVGGLIAASSGAYFESDRRSALAKALADAEWRQAKAEGRDKFLVCRGVDVGYDGLQVLFGVDFDVAEGEIVALLGTNGAGKSTLLRAISGSTEASGGAILCEGRDITHMPPHEVARRGVIHMPGGRGVFPGLSVGENLMLGTWMVDEPAEVDRRLAQTYEIFPMLAERRDARAGDLSGGQQQMLSLAQAFMAGPRLLLIDELSLGLAPTIVAELLDVVRRINAEGVTIVIVEQSVNVALTIAQRAIFMEKGEVRFVGPTADLLQRPDVLRAIYVKGTAGTVGRGPGTRVRPAAEARPPVLEVAGLTKHYGGVIALDQVDLSLGEGEVLGLIGPNGSGKTTLFEIISGYQAPDAGTVRFAGVDITDLPPDQRARRKLIRRFQDARLFPSLSVFETLLVALDQQAEGRSPLLSALPSPRARRAERRLRQQADRLVELLDLGDHRDALVRELSTGLRRIVDIAWVLAQEPVVLLLDEPSSGVAQSETEALAGLLRRVRRDTGCSLLVVEHDMPLITAVADELVALDRGQVVVRGPAEVVLEDERVIESYLGGSDDVIARSGARPA